MGCGGVGKSAVTVRFVNGMYLEWYDPTSESAIRREGMLCSRDKEGSAWRLGEEDGVQY